MSSYTSETHLGAGRPKYKQAKLHIFKPLRARKQFIDPMKEKKSPFLEHHLADVELVSAVLSWLS